MAPVWLFEDALWRPIRWSGDDRHGVTRPPGLPLSVPGADCPFMNSVPMHRNRGLRHDDVKPYKCGKAQEEMA